jgi:hypothetical protein
MVGARLSDTPPVFRERKLSERRALQVVRRADEKFADRIGKRRRPFGGMCAMRWASSIRSQPPLG